MAGNIEIKKYGNIEIWKWRDFCLQYAVVYIMGLTPRLFFSPLLKRVYGRLFRMASFTCIPTISAISAISVRLAVSFLGYI